mmetsp:Transcript_21451/g.18542  ORF Transcript_21451/g.18542 Transcript_21451/m.18542 type:complete len:95 (+) Transcript_21451:133-417(+)
MLAIINGYYDVVDLLISKGNAAVDSVSFSEYTPLILAAEKDQPEIIELLLTKGKAILKAQNSKGYTALMKATVRGCIDSVNVLLGYSDKETVDL